MATVINHDTQLDEDLLTSTDDSPETRHPLAATPVEAVYNELGPDVRDDVLSGSYGKVYGPTYAFDGGLSDERAAGAAWERICETITERSPDGRYYVPKGADIRALRDGDGPSFFEIVDREEVGRIIAEARTTQAPRREHGDGGY